MGGQRAQCLLVHGLRTRVPMSSQNPHIHRRITLFWYRGRLCRCEWATAPSSLLLSDGGPETDAEHCLPFWTPFHRSLRPFAICCGGRMPPEMRLGNPFQSALLSPDSGGGQILLHSPTEKRSATATDQGSCERCSADVARPRFRLVDN